MKNRIVGIMTVAGLAIGLGWNLGAQQAAAPQITPAEYALYEVASKADAKGRIAALDKWKTEFPKSDYADQRDNMYLITYNQLNDCRKAFDTSVQIRTKRPNYFPAINSMMTCIYQFGPTVSAADLTTAEQLAKYIQENEATIFADSNRGEVDAAQWATYKPAMLKAAQQTLAWVPIQAAKKDDAKAEVEITKFLQMDGTQSQFSYSLGQIMIGQAKQNIARMVPGIFHYARAAVYDGPNAIAPASRQTLRDYVTRAYKTYHGSEEGLPDLLAVAKTNVFPPAGFSIKDVNTINAEKAAAAAAEDAKDPAKTFWRDTVRTPLLEPNGAMTFMSNFEGAKLPGGINGVMAFKGKIVSLTPVNQPKELVLAVFDSTIPDAKLVFEEALPGTMDVGSELSFNGVAKSYTKEPFMITFSIDKDDVKTDLVGWTGVNPKGAKGAKAPAATKGAKAPASKGKGK